MSAPRNPPFRAEHLGSLLRPGKLLDKRHAIQQRRDSAHGLEAIQNDCIKDVVKTEQDCGFRAITDGEYGRHMSVVHRYHAEYG